MKITYAKFINFAKIYAGTGRKELELSFKDAISDITLLIGKNGSGKSTIESILNPMREPFVILPNHDGYKEIHLEDKNNNKYIIKHYYGETSSKNKSYISKNNIELNDNGGIKLFYSILEKEMNLTKDYFTIGKMGAGFAGFIGMSTSERKTYINKFVPNIDEYLNAYDKINDKFKSYNKDIKTLKESIDEINIDNLNITKSTKENELLKYIKEKEKLQKNIILLSNDIEKLNNELLLPDNFDEDYKTSLEEFNNYKEVRDKFFIKFPKLKNFTLDTIDLKLEANKNEQENLNKQIENSNKESEDLNDTIDKLYKDINKIDNQLILEKENYTDPKEIKKEIDELEDNNKNLHTTLNNVINNLNNENFLLVQLLDKNELTNRTNEIKHFFSNIETIKAESTMNIIDNTNFNLEKEYQININNNNKEIQKINNDINDLSIKVKSIENDKIKYDKILLNKPSNCANSNCAFIKDAIYFKNNIYPKQYNEILDIISENENRLALIIKDNDELNEKLKFIINVKKYVFDYSNDFEFLPLIIDIKKDFNLIIKSTNMYEEKVKNIAKLCSNYKSIKEEIEQNDKILSLKNEIYKINLSKEKLINSYETDKNTKEIDIEKLKDKLLSLSEAANKASDRNKILNNTNNLLIKVKEVLIAYEEASKKYNEYDILYQNNKNKLQLLKQNQKDLIDLEADLNEINKEINILNGDIDEIKNNLFLFKTYSNKLRTLESDIQDLSIIKDCLDPKKGIPLIFMKNYLNSISKATNDLLDTAYNGDFKIKFKITSKEFLINVYKGDGTILDDISMASEGEKSLTIISLSLAMLSVLFGDSKYDIIYLDEIDGPLDNNNRKNFLNILKSQLKSSMSQCFIISHNDEFYSSDVNLILLKNHNLDTTNEEIMENKTVIFDINK